MKKLLYFVALAGLLLSPLLYFFAPNAEATPVIVADCGSDNPYSETNITPPSVPHGPFMCPVGTSLNRVCASVAAGKFNTECVAAAVVAGKEWIGGCNLLQAGTITQDEFDAGAGVIDAEYWSNVGLAAGRYYAAMAECCGWNETALFQDDHDGLFCGDSVNPYVGTNHVMPWPLCPVEKSLFMPCVDAAKTAFDAAMATADATAATAWTASCDTMHDDFNKAFAAYHSCIDGGGTPMECALVQLRLQTKARNRRKIRDDAIKATHDAALAAALAAAANSLADCCIDDE